MKLVLKFDSQYWFIIIENKADPLIYKIKAKV